MIFAGESAIPPEWESLPWCLIREQSGVGWNLRTWMAASPSGLVHRIESSLGKDEVTTLLFNADGSLVHIHWFRTAQDGGAFWKDLSGWVLEAGLGFVPRLRGWPVLHGSVVAVDGRAIGLLGHKGAGKSTLAAAFLAGGFPLLSDDHVVLKPEGAVFMAQPGPPRLRLWPSSLPVLGTPAVDLPRVYSFLEKRLVELDPVEGSPPTRFQTEPLPLGALYILEPRDSTRSEPAIEVLPPISALHQALVFRWSRVPLSPEHAAAELSGLARLAQTIPIRRVRRPDSLDSLAQVVDAIRKDAGSHAV